MTSRVFKVSPFALADSPEVSTGVPPLPKGLGLVLRLLPALYEPYDFSRCGSGIRTIVDVLVVADQAKWSVEVRWPFINTVVWMVDALPYKAGGTAPRIHRLRGGSAITF